MPKRNIPSGEVGFFDTSSIGVQDKQKSHKGLKSALAVTGGGLALSYLASVHGIGEAKADSAWIGGCGDTESGMFVQTAIDQGRYNFNEANLAVHYDAAMGPVACGDTPTNVSIDQAKQQGVQFYYDHRGNGTVRESGFSLGAGAIDAIGMQLKADNGGTLPGDVDLHAIGDAWNPIGMQQNPFARIAEVVTVPMGIPTPEQLHPVAGMTEEMDGRDAWATGGVSTVDFIDTIVKLGQIPTNHAVPPEDMENITAQKDGITYKIATDPEWDGWQIQAAIATAPAPGGIPGVPSIDVPGVDPNVAPPVDLAPPAPVADVAAPVLDAFGNPVQQ